MALNKKSILFITTQYRAGERIYPIIPYLAEDYTLDLLKVYHMHPQKGKWGGNQDLRKVFDQKYSKYFFNKFISVSDISNLSQYDLILVDDNRVRPELTDIYYRRNCLMIGNSHGCSDHKYEIINYKKCFDGFFVFGQKECTQSYHIPGGIPANDNLKNYLEIKKEHILVITNFLGWEPTLTDMKGFTFKKCNKHFFDSLHLLELQKRYNKKIIIKIKSREDQPFQRNIDYIKSLLPLNLDYKILVDVEDDNLLIAKSCLVLGPPSTLALKAIQSKIPTVLFKGYGQTSVFKNYKYLMNIEDFNPTLNFQPQKEWIEETIQGGLTWDSTNYYLNYIKQLLNG
ncbi:MAG: hypothetical protein CL662_00340 [Bacteroidetes bacterium]|nr:hypothetical protein [Bacteroidota bacterium]|tara:strand:+ start:1514 stop:2539 length:1026 start_codon:yes stop_codon:yes gene_type:complete